MSEFVHLHLHSQYSFLDGAIKIKDLIPKIKELGMDTVALTDHGHMHGIVDFYKTAKKGGVKPIIGCEAYVSKKGRETKERKDSYHMVLLAKNNIGYKNLMHLVSIGYIEGFYYRPRMDREVLRKYSEGLIGLSACLGGMLSQSIMSGNLKEARELALDFKDIFEEDSYYLEIQENGIPEQSIVNRELIKMSKELDIPLVATNDSHYVLREHSEAHDILMKIQMRQTISSGRRHETDAYYIRSPKEIKELFHYAPEAVANTVKIANMCNVEIELGKYYLPEFPVPDGYTEGDYFEEVARVGLEERLKDVKNLTPEKRKIYEDRLDFEMGVIKQMGFPGYFLIVWDFIKFSKDNNIPVGPGRGSGAGSIVAYSMKITDLDPIPLDLLFERFLNPDRVSMPDFDIDFCQNRRDEVIDYVKNKYGSNRVAQIASFSKLKAKSVVRDVGRVLEIPLPEVDKLAKMIPDSPGIKNLDMAMEENPKIEEAMENNPDYKRIIEIGKSLEGLYRQSGVHAAGLVISNKDLWEYTPVFKGSQDDKYLTTQFEKNNVEEVGLVKFDFLGLKTLTVIAKAVEYVNAQKKEGEEPLDILKIDIDDPNIYKVYAKGQTDGIFQFESAGMKKYLKDLKPDCFDNIIAMNALYRPGPMEYIPTYINRKHGKERVVYDHPAMAEFLEETYGVTVYQEQVMLLSRKLGGFTRGQADTLRKAMGKKKKSLLDQLYPQFVEGCKRIHNIPESLAKKIWSDWESFAKYAFNKAHAASYAYVSLQTAYLKHYHAAEFAAASLSFESNNTDKIVKHITSIKKEGLIVVPPDINKSHKDFTVINNDIIFGLSAVKGLGDAALENIIEERKNGEFKDFYGMIKRVDGRKVNKKAFESLINAGAFDQLEKNRAMLLNSLEDAIKSAQEQLRIKKSKVRSLFGNTTEAGIIDSFHMERVEDFSLEERLNREKEVLGFYISGHPADKFREEFQDYGLKDISEILDSAETIGEREFISVLAMFGSFRKITTKSKALMGVALIEDGLATIEIVIFPKTYKKYEALLENIDNQAFIFGGKLQEDTFGKSEGDDNSDKKYKILVNSIIEPYEYRKDNINGIKLELIDEKIDQSFWDLFNNLIISQQPGKTTFSFTLFSERYNALIEFEDSNQISIQPNKLFLDNLKDILRTKGKIKYL